MSRASSTQYATEASGCEQSDQSIRLPDSISHASKKVGNPAEAAVPSSLSRSRPSTSFHVSTETVPRIHSPFSCALHSLHMNTRLPRRATTPRESGGRNPAEKKRRPKRPLSAYNYFFNHECKQIKNLLDSSNGTCSTCTDGNNCGPTKKAKRRKSSHDDPSVPLEDMDVGKAIIGRWKKLSEVERAKYEALALIDSERYEREVAQYFKVGIPARRLSTTSLPEHSELTLHKNRSTCMPGQEGGGALSTSMLPALSSALSSPFDASPKNKFGFYPFSVTKSSIGSSSSPCSEKVTARLNDNGKDDNRSNKKTRLQAMLAGRRNEMLSDISDLKELAAIKSSRTRGSSSHSSGFSFTHQNDAGTMQRIFNLHAGGSSVLWSPPDAQQQQPRCLNHASSASRIPASITSTSTYHGTS